jgi:methyl-accepting chemotaxis protein
MGWAEVVTAISTAIIAIGVVAAGFMVVVTLNEFRSLARAVQRVAELLERDARPTLDSARRLVDDAQHVVSSVRREAEDIVDSSQDVRERMQRLLKRTEERLQDLDALIDVVQYEVEETALDVAAALRTTRRGATVFRAVKRAFLGRGR